MFLVRISIFGIFLMPFIDIHVSWMGALNSIVKKKKCNFAFKYFHCLSFYYYYSLGPYITLVQSRVCFELDERH
ncbi:hypothetical protein BD560DRAFT_387385 [Blakeslea trispora]|nr:hypothetical protein BD560DRAFT_387385 [Blakeslea trispora]